MSKDKIFKVIGAILIIASLFILFASNDTTVIQCLLALLIGAGIGLLTKGEKSFGIFRKN